MGGQTQGQGSVWIQHPTEAEAKGGDQIEGRVNVCGNGEIQDLCSGYDEGRSLLAGLRT